jgi:ribosome-binding protein aMBF1 (putative translation factor)
LRKIKHGSSYYSRYLKGLPKGVCDLCGGRGRYKETFKYKNAIIHNCRQCSGTGKVKIKVTYIGDNKDLGLWKGFDYEVITESETSYVVLNRDKEMLQVEKSLFKLNK